MNLKATLFVEIKQKKLIPNANLDSIESIQDFSFIFRLFVNETFRLLFH